MRVTDFQRIHISGEGLRTLGIYRLFFARALADVMARRAAYDAVVAEWYETGDGASPEWVEAGTQPWFDAEHDDPSRRVNIGGKGYRFPQCPHGMSLWTDYDNICGACEESETVTEEARGYAREAYLRFSERWEWFNAAPVDLQYQLPTEYAALREWMFSLFPKGD